MSVTPELPPAYSLNHGYPTERERIALENDPGSAFVRRSGLSGSFETVMSRRRSNISCVEYVALLDSSRKGYVEDNDLFEAIYSVGFEPSHAEIDMVLGKDPRSIDPEKIKSLFSNYNVGYESLKNKLSYFRLNR